MNIQAERLVDRFIRYCKVNTPPKSERPLADLVEKELVELGLDCTRDRVHEITGGDSGNLIATLKGNAPGIPIFFSAHFDTVAPNPGVHVLVDGDIVRSDGNSILGADDKGPMASIVEAIHSLIEEGEPHGDIQLLFSVSEEIGLLGATHLDLGKVHAEFGFVLDSGPPMGSVVTSAPSQTNLYITVYGRPAHAGAEPEKGVSAIGIAASAIERMRLGRIDDETTANVGVIAGGSATNIVCPRVDIRAEARSRDRQKLTNQVEHMKSCFEVAASARGGLVEIEIVPMYVTYMLNEEEPPVSVALDVAGQLGLPAITRAAGGGSDANAYNARGLKCCVLATGMRDIHTHEENIAISDLVTSAQMIRQIIRFVARQ